MIHMTSTGGSGDTRVGARGPFTVTCRCGWTAGGFETRNAARTAGDAHLAVANAPEKSGECKHCGRRILLEEGTWIDPEATGDDSLWRETCDGVPEGVWPEHEPVTESLETVATLMSDGAEVVNVNVAHDADVDPLQIAASAYASITGVRVGDAEFTLSEIREFWA